ncbi:phosphatidylinositol 4-kinase Pik1p [[Candida] anglica]|uniref:1-phosphatidylinositol 4-kinase n=1 Tax=[Candida] anglica TaxID=148631 RepID=A0ABP0EHP1_9ASCO
MSEEYQHILTDTDAVSFDAFQCIDYLRLYPHNIGVHQFLVKKLRAFPYDELEFFIPQLVQLFVAFETESMAIEDFLMEYCTLYPHFSLIVFWSLQAYIFELRNDPESYSFQAVRRFINNLQNVIFNTDVSMKVHSHHIEFRENLQPSVILCGMIAASIAAPRVNEYASGLIRSQGRQQKSFVFKLANFQKTLTKNLTMKNTRLSLEGGTATLSDDETIFTTKSSGSNRKISLPNNDVLQRSSSLSHLSTSRKVSTSSVFSSDNDSETYTTDDDLELKLASVKTHESRNESDYEVSHKKFSDIEEKLKINTQIKSKKSIRRSGLGNEILDDDKKYKYTSNVDQSFVSRSMPDLSKSGSDSQQDRPYLSKVESASSVFNARHSTEEEHPGNTAIQPSQYSSQEGLKLLQVNYARKETEFIMSLQNISIRLSQVPKEARLSALRAELSIINQKDLPSEIDIPQLLPVTSNKNKKYHKILKLNVNEACVLNSAERVPFLLLIEYLSDEMDFNPFSEENQKILKSRISSHHETRNRNESNALPKAGQYKTVLNDYNSLDDTLEGEADLSDMKLVYRKETLRDLDNPVLLTERLSQVSLQDEGGFEVPALPASNPDVPTKVLADQMRIASVMLQQLESSGKSTSEQSQAIRKRIIESMKSLQDQFDSIDYNKIKQLEGNIHNAGERKLENDFKLGEDWNTKKLRIRKSSVYGHLKNWDLCSVIVKNGDDLPQEAFACQLISMISNIWKKRGIGAWTKRMKILITSANAGLVETITNAMSIHSIKKSLTELSITEGENTKGRIFTLKDYFERMYSHEDSHKYKQAQNNFASSLASYSIICYVLQIKDRHNGNIMLDNEGHIIHIDFGFLLSNSPGSVGFEAAPFKLTGEYVDVLGGVDSEAFTKFKKICKDCFSELRKNSDQIVNIVELMQKDSSLPCFKNGENTSVLLRQRLQLHLSDEESDSFVENILIGKSLGSMYTRLYDQFQMVTQGIYS